MIARRKRSRERRNEVLHRLSGLTGKAERSRSRCDPGEAGGHVVESLGRVLAELGPVFAAYGVYLASRADLLRSDDRKALAALGRSAAPLSPAIVGPLVEAETTRARAVMGELATPADSIAALDEQPFDARLLFQRHHGRLASGAAVIVRVARPLRSAETDLELLLLLRDPLLPLLGDARTFARSVDDFRTSFRGEVNGLALADVLELLGRDARGLDTLLVPGVYRGMSTSHVLVLERLPGRRLGGSAGTEAKDDDADAGADGPRAGRAASHGLARLLCELCLWQAFDGGVIPTDPRPENLIVQGSSRIAVDEGTFAVLPQGTRQNLLKYLLAVAIDEPRKALDCLLPEFEAGRHRTGVDQLDRLFRQMTPDGSADETTDERTGTLASTVLAQWRLAIENGYTPLRHGVHVLRGIVRLDETAQALAPGSDALLEGLKDYRLGRLLGDFHSLFEPMTWIGRTDKLMSLMMSAPRILDEAIAAALPDRAAEERKTQAPHGPTGRLHPWAVPAIAAMAVIGLGYGRGPPSADRAWTEVLSAVAFLLLGRWVLTIASDAGR